MNKTKINELYERAHVVHEIRYESSVVDPAIVSVHKQRVFDRFLFAELIVEECVKEIEFQFGGGSDQPMDSEWDRAIECASSMVKYRFGVEK